MIRPMSVGGPSQQIPHWNLMGTAEVARTSGIAKRRERGSRQPRIVWGETNRAARDARKSPHEIPGFRRFTWGRRIW